MDYKKDIKELLEEIHDEWILSQVLRFIKNITA